MRRLVVVGALAAGALLCPTAQAAGPQLIDPANDANMSWKTQTTAGEHSHGNQPYADVLSVEWKTLKQGRKVTGLQVIMTLAAPPVPPPGVTIGYLATGTMSVGCPMFGVSYWTSPNILNENPPQSALLCASQPSPKAYQTNKPLTPIDLPVIKGKTITWTVPLTAIPADWAVRPGTLFTKLLFRVAPSQSYPAVPNKPFPICVPFTGTPDGGTVGGCRTDFYPLDKGNSDNPYKLS